MTDNDNKYLTLLALGITGIVVAFFAYLIYNQNRERDRHYQMSLINQNQSKPTDEIVKMLQNQQNQLTNHQQQIDYILSLKVPVQQPELKSLEIPKQDVLPARHALNQKTDKNNETAKKFNMQ